MTGQRRLIMGEPVVLSDAQMRELFGAANGFSGPLPKWGVGADEPIDVLVITGTGLEKRTITARAIFAGQPDEETK